MSSNKFSEPARFLTDMTYLNRVVCDRGCVAVDTHDEFDCFVTDLDHDGGNPCRVDGLNYLEVGVGDYELFVETIRECPYNIIPFAIWTDFDIGNKIFSFSQNMHCLDNITDQSAVVLGNIFQNLFKIKMYSLPPRNH